MDWMMRLHQRHGLHRYLLQGDGSGRSDVAVYIGNLSTKCTDSAPKTFDATEGYRSSCYTVACRHINPRRMQTDLGV
jgi:hypothetical protein